VASIVLEVGGGEDEAIAALLHDAVEDAPKDLDPNAGAFVRKWIGLKFGSCVQAIVDACTDADTRDESGKKLDWIVRKTAYIDGIAHKSAGACLVSAADKVHNARAILRDYKAEGKHVWGRFNREAGGRDAIVGITVVLLTLSPPGAAARRRSRRHGRSVSRRSCRGARTGRRIQRCLAAAHINGLTITPRQDREGPGDAGRDFTARGESPILPNTDSTKRGDGDGPTADATHSRRAALAEAAAEAV
jgi:hypothetical protein